MSTRPEKSADLVWEIATLYPPQGTWSEEGYLSLTNATNRLIEFTDGRVEFLEMPTKIHQLMLMHLLDSLRAYLRTHQPNGIALPAPLRVRIRPGKYREPDIVFMSAGNLQRAGNEYYEGADLVMEIVSDDPESRHRDLVEKVADYAEAAIPEYWIVDAHERKITILTQPNGGTYATRQNFAEGDEANGDFFPDFKVAVGGVFACCQ